jgi:hypothetical protein
MAYSPSRLMATALLLLSGCATPMFSGVAKGNKADSGANGPALAAAAAPTASEEVKTSLIADRKAPDDRLAPRGTPTTERRIADLLAAASRSQKAGRLDSARSAYEQVLRLHPWHLTANYQLACIADDEGRFADAERHYSALMHNPDLLASLGWSYLLQGRYDDSERTLREALRFAPTHQTALYNLGWLYGTRGEYEQALAIFRSAGTEAEAQRAIAELQQGARSQNTGYQKQQPDIRDRANAKRVAAPTPRNDGRAALRDSRAPAESQWGSAAGNLVNNQSAGNRNGNPPDRSGRTEAVPINGMFTEVDAFASESPVQANQARQADPRLNDLNAERGGPGAPGGRAGRTEPINFELSTRSADGSTSPVITPRSPGGGHVGSRQGVTAWNALPAANPSSSEAGSNDTAAAQSAAEWQRSPKEDVRFPDGPPVGASRPAEAAPQRPHPIRRGQNSQQDAQAMAAQLGLGAGAGGPVFPLGDWASPAPAMRTPESSVLAAPATGNGVRPSIPAEGSVSGQRSGGSRQSPVTQTAGFAPPLAPQASGLPTWPGRSAVPAPIPTEVTPSAPTLPAGAGTEPPLPGILPGRTPFVPSR